MGLPYRLVGLDDALQILRSRLQKWLDGVHSFLWLVPLVRPAILLLLVSLCKLFFIEPFLLLLGDPRRRSQMYLRLLRQNVVGSLPCMRRVLAGLTLHVPPLLLFQLVCMMLVGVLLL